jgi:hypothetical protein
MGDPASEARHGLEAAFPPVVETKDRSTPPPSVISDTPPSKVIKGALGESARVLLPRTPAADMYGGELNFTMKVDPVNQNYFTVKFWGSDTSDDGSVILNCEGFEIGKRHGNSAADLFANHGGPWFPGRFWYRTATLPLKLTQGKTSVQIKLRSAGKIYDYNNKHGKTYIPDYQHLMGNPSWQLYRAYTHVGGYVDTTGEVQGTAPELVKRASPGPEVIDQWKEVVNNKVSGMLKRGIIDGGNIASVCRDIGYLAQCYQVSWCTGYRRPEVVATLVKSIDRVASRYAENKQLAGEEWGGSFGPMGEAIWRLAPQFASRLSETVDFGGDIGRATRRDGWARALRASVDAGRFRRRTITNQEVICAENIYAANKGILAIAPAAALAEKEALRYPYEAAGLSPFLGDDLPGNGPVPKRGNAPFGPDWYHVTTDGTTKEPSFVASDYGEMAVGVYRMAVMAGDRNLRAQALKMLRVRAYFRIPSVDANGNFVMMAAAPIGARNNYLPAHHVYITRDVSDTGASFLVHENIPELAGWFRQQLDDGQLYAMIAGASSVADSDGNNIGRKAGQLHAPFFPDDFAAALKKANGAPGPLMPTAPGAPDFAWGDEENMVVAAKHGEELFFTNMVWRGTTSINRVAMIFTLNPRTASRAEVQLDDIRYVATGAYETMDGSVDSFGNKNPPDNKTYPSAEQDNRYPIAIRPDLKTPPERNNDGGRGTGYTLCYGHWLVGMNGNYTTGDYTMKLPPGFTSGLDLVSGQTLTTPIVIPKGTTVVFYLPAPAAIPTSPAADNDTPKL